MCTFPEFNFTINLKNETTSKNIVQQVKNNLGLDTKTNMTDDRSLTLSVKVNFYPKKGTHSVCFADKYIQTKWMCST